MTPSEVGVLALVATSRVLTNPQLARLLGISDVAVRRHTHRLAARKLIREVPNVTRVTLAPLRVAGDLSLAEGKPPKAFILTPEGVREARRLGVDPPTPPAYRERAMYLGHDVLAQDVRVWLATSCRTHGHELIRWVCGDRSIIGNLRPDAWFAYKLPAATLVGFVEADRGSEEKDEWLKKERQYAALFTGDALFDAIKYRRGWVLAVTETTKRRDRVASWVTHERIRVVSIGELKSSIEDVTWRKE